MPDSRDILVHVLCNISYALRVLCNIVVLALVNLSNAHLFTHIYVLLQNYKFTEGRAWINTCLNHAYIATVSVRGNDIRDNLDKCAIYRMHFS